MTYDFEIVPYEGAGVLKFGASRQEVEAILGVPEKYHRTDYPPDGLEPCLGGLL